MFCMAPSPLGRRSPLCIPGAARGIPEGIPPPSPIFTLLFLCLSFPIFGKGGFPDCSFFFLAWIPPQLPAKCDAVTPLVRFLMAGMIPGFWQAQVWDCWDFGIWAGPGVGFDDPFQLISVCASLQSCLIQGLLVILYSYK